MTVKVIHEKLFFIFKLFVHRRIYKCTVECTIQCSGNYLSEAARRSWLAVVPGVQSMDSGESGDSGAAPPQTADGYSPMTAYNTTAES